jgi:hypothetical protein
MNEPTKKKDWTGLEEMKKIIDQLDGLLTDLERLGREMPVIEKNVKAMMSFVAVLKYGISDLVDTQMMNS